MTSGLGSAAQAIRVVLADDDDVLLGALNALLATDAGIEVVGSARDGRIAQRMAAETRPDVVVTDLRMPFGGPPLVEALNVVAPTAAVICFTADPHGRGAMMSAGAVAYVLKGSADLDLIAVIKRAASVPPG